MARGSRSRGSRSSMRGGRSTIARSRQGRTVALSAKTGGVGQFSSRGGGGGGGGGGKGFKSKAQWRYFFANPKLRKYARKKAHETAGGKKIRYRRLPMRKGVSARSAR